MNISKNEQIKKSIIQTKLKRQFQKCRVIELKINMRKVHKKQFNKLKMTFVECKWLYNYLLNLKKEELFNFDTKIKNIYSLDKQGNKINRQLQLPSAIKQTVYSVLCNNIKSLSQLKKKDKKIGKLKFKSDYKSIDLKQYNNTHKFMGNNKIRITGLGIFHVHGLKQIKPDWEFANAKLIKKPSGYYILLTCYENLTLNNVNTNSNKIDCGLDFGIKTNIITSDGEKINVCIGETERLKNLQRKKARQIKNSNNYKRTLHKIQIEYEKMSNKKKNFVNQITVYLCYKYNKVYIQDEMIKAWHKKYGKQVQHSFMGKLKEKLKQQNNVFVINKSYPTTKMCYNCGHIHKDITLNDRTFICPSCGFSEDRDIKAAKTVMYIGQCINNHPVTEHNRLSNVEKMSDFLNSYEFKKHSPVKH